MKTQNKLRHKQPKPETYAEGCQRIISKFNDPSKPLSTHDFKAMLFFSLMDTYTQGDQASVSNDHVATMYFLWDILDDIEALQARKQK